MKVSVISNNIAATMRRQVSVNFFNILFNKKGRNGYTGAHRFDEEIKEMTFYSTTKINEMIDNDKKLEEGF